MRLRRLGPIMSSLLLVFLLQCGRSDSASPAAVSAQQTVLSALPVAKSNPLPIYAHYMPWFADKKTSGNGRWGLHWTMANADPEQTVGDRRSIAAHFYPLVGPYASSDLDLIDYHLLLMKFSGIDGLLIDWPSAHEALDYGLNRRNAEALIGRLEAVGLRFAMVYEDYTVAEVAKFQPDSVPLEIARADLGYIAAHYFTRESYIHIDGAPLLLVFGPRLFETAAQWEQVLAGIAPAPAFLALWHQSADLGSHAAGEFSWVYKNHLTDLQNFYEKTVPTLDIAFGSAYPGFADYYAQGGWGDGLGWQIAHAEGATLAQTLALAETADIDALQLVTWNDFGEGTMLEPTREFGYTLLEQVQRFAGVVHTRTELELVYELYVQRKKYVADPVVQEKLELVFYYLVSLQIEEANALLKTIQ